MWHRAHFRAQPDHNGQPLSRYKGPTREVARETTRGGVEQFRWSPSVSASRRAWLCRAQVTIWVAEPLAADDDNMGTLREEVMEALNLSADTDSIRVLPFVAGTSPVTTRVLTSHPTPMLDMLQTAIRRTSCSPECSQATTPPIQQRRSLLSAPRRRHTAIVLHGLKV